jgi:hydroxymethylpyrimidine pyrophosphatase-like HAD family hydrolase
MGKPFNQELEKLASTYHWALSAPIENIDNLRNSLVKSPLFIVGSGGSLSACILFATLQQYNGSIANAITPLEFQYSKNAITHDTNIVFISASGKNTDILFAFENALKKEPKCILSICLKKNTPLSKKSLKYSIAKTIELENPAGKDGFLATNSLLAYFTIIARLYNQSEPIKSIIPSLSFLNEISKFSNSLHEDFTITVLYGGWGKPVAFDIESKFSEAGLGNILLSDYRNFGHGRHNWFDKKSKQSAIIALITPEEVELAEKTLGLLPKKIPVLKITSNGNLSNASLDLLVKSFYLVEEIGKLKTIDPGKPGVPEYGSKLYNLNYSRIYKEKKLKISEKNYLAISRKIGQLESLSIQEKHLTLWNNAYLSFIKKINSTLFKGIILDYDGTLCGSLERFDGPSKKINEQLTGFLNSDILIGVVTGRGKSVRTDLQKIIPKKYWNKFVIGYYNGSQIGTLADNDLPITNTVNTPTYKVLSEINDFLTSEPTLAKFIKSDIRPNQLTIEVLDKPNSELLKGVIIDTLKNINPFNIQVLESSHSVDVIPISTNKVSIIQACRDLLSDKKGKYNFLCIGDRGRWPGNDYQLLATEFSLSVDKVSMDPSTCWNLSSIGNNCVDSTIEYFDSIKPIKSQFKINL